MKTAFIYVFIFSLMWTGLSAQEPAIRWKREEPQTKEQLHLFHSIHAVNLPTAETLKKNELEYEISHRFIPTVTTDNAYFGIDGPANIRTALAYAITNHLMITVGRSNLQDNYDFRLKYQFYQLDNPAFPVLLAARAGLGWNTEVYGSSGKLRDKTDTKNFQYYGQLIFNTMLWKKLGIGVVPSYLYNSHILCVDTEYSFTVGSYLQYYVSTLWSVFFETNTTVTGFRRTYNPITLGIELETGGHFFKIFLSNSRALNPTQFLAGADLNVRDGDWRLGFNITRILKL